MEVSLDLIASTEKLLPELGKIKKATTEVDESAKKVGTSMDSSFKKGEQAAQKLDKQVVNNTLTYARMERAINDTVTKGISKFIVAQEEADKKIKKVTKTGEEGFKSFKTRILEATREVGILQEKFKQGLIPEQQLKSAKQGLANLKEEFGDFQAEIDALNPEAKFTAFAQVTTGIAGGFAAAQGAMALFGSESEDVNKALLKVNAALAFSQGINQILGLGDAFRNLKEILLASSAASKVAEAAHEGIVTSATHAGESIYYVAHGHETATHAINSLAKANKSATVITGIATAAQIENNVAVNGSTIMQQRASGATVFHTGVVKTATVWTNIATVATNLWGLAMNALPFVAIAVGAYALYSAVKSFGDEVETLEEKTAKFAAAQEAFARAVEENNTRHRQRQQLISSEIDLLRAQGATEAEIAAKRKQLTEDTLAGYRAEVDENANRIKEINAAQRDLQEELEKTNSKEVLAEIEKNAAIIKGIEKRNDAILVEAKIFGNSLSAESSKDAKEKAEKDKKSSDDEIAKRKKLHEDLLAAEKSYNDAIESLRLKVLSATSEQASGIERLRIQKQLADNEISNLRASLIEKGQEEEKAAAAKQGRAVRVFELSEAQEEQFHILDMLLLKKFNKDVEDLQLQNEKAKLELITNTNEHALKEFDITFKERAKKLREAGATEFQIEELKNRDLSKLKSKLGEDSLSLEEKIQTSIVEARERGKQSELEFERQKALDILKIQLNTAKEKLKLNLALLQSGDSSAERQEAIANLDSLINTLKTKIANAQTELATGQKKLSIARLLGITGVGGKALTAEEEAQFNEAALSIVGSVTSIFQSALEQQSILNEQAIANNDAYIDSLNERISATQQALNKELEDQKKGYANNVDAKRKEIEGLNAEKQKAIEEDKKLQKERKRIAQEQAVIDAIVQSSQLLAAGATLFAKGAFSGPVGIITAIATIAAMVAAFVGLKSKISQATKFESGGTIGGRTHAQGGQKYVSQDGTGRVVELEVGEEVVNRKASQRYRKLIKGIGAGRLDYLSSAQINSLLSGTGVTLREGVEKNIAQQSVLLHRAEINHTTHVRLDGVEKRLDNLHNELSGVHKHLVSLPSVITLNDGTQKITQRSGDVETVTIIHKT